MYVIVNYDRPASMFAASRSHTEATGQSYTGLLQKAKLFMTREAAMKEKCGNEIILPIREIMESHQ